MSVPIKTEEVIVEHAEYNSAEEFEEDLQLQLEDSGGETTYIQSVSEHHQPRQRQNSNMNLSGTTAKNSGASKLMLDSEKRIRREIANSNERRRMQSINAGFQNLRSLLPRHEGEKLSKASILQQTSQYICELEEEKNTLIALNNELKRQLGQQVDTPSGSSSSNNATTNSTDTTTTSAGVTIKKRKLTDNVINVQTISDSSDEGLGSMSPEPMTLLTGGSVVGGTTTATATTTKSQVLNNANLINATKELVETKKQLDKERRLRTLLEDELQGIKRQLYSVATAPVQSSVLSGTSYIPREVIEHTDNLMHDSIEELGQVSYVEINEMTGQQQVVICSSIEELESEAAAAAADIITEDTIHEEVILSSTSESEQEVNVNAIAKAYAQGTSPTAAVLQPILQAAIKAKPKVEVERINEALARVKTEKIEQPNTNNVRSRQNLETIVEAIRHLEGDHLFGDVAEQQKLHSKSAQDMPLALTTKQQQQVANAQRTTLAELRPFLHLKGNKQVTIVGGPGGAVTLTSKLAHTGVLQRDNTTATPTAIYRVQTGNSGLISSNNSSSTDGSTIGSREVTITTSALKQCRPGVIVAKQLS